MINSKESCVVSVPNTKGTFNVPVISQIMKRASKKEGLIDKLHKESNRHITIRIILY